MKSCVIYGTRPEMIKLSILTTDYIVDSIYVDQQPDLSEFYKNLMPEPNYTIPLQSGNLNDRFSETVKSIGRILESRNYDNVIVQGDTLTACAGAIAAFHLGIKISHVEAGLRTNDILSPFPEEGYRSIISRIATYNFCPTKRSKDNLEKENVPGVCYVTGNTVIDLVDRMSCKKPLIPKNHIIVTLHRRENIPHIKSLLEELKLSVNKHPEINWIVPLHPNPQVKDLVKKSLENTSVLLSDPIDYPDFIDLLRTCIMIITDSGGIQEEAAYFKKKVVVCRKSTERPEGIEAGFSTLGFENLHEEIENCLLFPQVTGGNPYGDGKSSKRISSILNLTKRI